jgi:hypothetical protein
MTLLPESTEDSQASQASSELMLLPDGRMLAHHLTPELALVLRQITGVSEASTSSAESVPDPS